LSSGAPRARKEEELPSLLSLAAEPLRGFVDTMQGFEPQKFRSAARSPSPTHPQEKQPQQFAPKPSSEPQRFIQTARQDDANQADDVLRKTNESLLEALYIEKTEKENIARKLAALKVRQLS